MQNERNAALQLENKLLKAALGQVIGFVYASMEIENLMKRLTQLRKPSMQALPHLTISSGAAPLSLPEKLDLATTELETMQEQLHKVPFLLIPFRPDLTCEAMHWKSRSCLLARPFLQVIQIFQLRYWPCAVGLHLGLVAPSLPGV